MWPLFTGGKRIFASRIGNRMVDLAKAGREEAGATLLSELVETYYALRLAQRVVEEAYYSSVLGLLGLQAIDEGRVITFPDEYKIPYLNFA